MVKYLYCILCVCLHLQCFGQNLVPNGSFEDTVYCPVGSSQVDAASGWFIPRGTPEYFNPCTVTPWLSVPTNIAGVQSPSDGQAYCGQYIYNPIGVNDREYIAIRLVEPLKAGQEYCVSFWVSLAEQSKYAVSTYGAFFSHDTVFNYDNHLIDTIPQVENSHPNVLFDQSNWTEISGSFIANGGEEYITLGNFRQDSVTALNQQIVLMTSELSYYYVDQVSVSENACSNDTLYVDIPNVFTPNADGINDRFEFSVEGYESGIATIYNRWGQKIYEFNPLRGHWDGYTQAGVQVPEGVYFYSLSCSAKDAEPFVTKGSIQLIR